MRGIICAAGVNPGGVSAFILINTSLDCSRLSGVDDSAAAQKEGNHMVLVRTPEAFHLRVDRGQLLLHAVQVTTTIQGTSHQLSRLYSR